jgi:hypothetical protein
MRFFALLGLLLLVSLLVYLPQQHDENAATEAARSGLLGDDTGTQADQDAANAQRQTSADKRFNNNADQRRADSATDHLRRAGRNPFRDQAARAAANSATTNSATTSAAQQEDLLNAVTDGANSDQVLSVEEAEASALLADEEETDAGTGSISGRVMDDQGEPVAGAAVVATQQPDGRGKAGGEQFSTSAAADGWFTFTRLPSGEYIISARDTVSATSSNSVRAGTGTPLVDLMIPLLNEVLLFGAVTDATQQPVAGARVVLAPSAISTSTDELGVYLLAARLRNQQSYQLIAEHDGYADARVPLPLEDWRQTPEWQLDVQLERQQQTTVTGLLLDEDAAAVSDENLYLQSQRNTYQARSDAVGGFSFNAVAPGPDYRLTVAPSRGYKSYQQSGIDVPDEGLFGLEVVLEAIADGQLTGQFIDPFGAALPGYSATLLVQRFRTIVQADAQGRFMLDEVPAGEVQLRNDSIGLISTRGARLAPGGQLQLQAMVDVGTGQYVGSLLNEVGMPVAGAAVTLMWRRQDQGVLHESAREAISDANGRFAFSGHAAVDHQLRVIADGYQPLIIQLPAQTTGSELTLQPLP